MKNHLKQFLCGLLLFSLAACQGSGTVLPLATIAPLESPTIPSQVSTPTPIQTATPTATIILENTPITPSLMPPTATFEPTSTNSPTPTLIPDSVVIWPNLSALILHPTEVSFTVQETELFAEGLRQGQGWTSVGWNIPGAFYNEGDHVYVRGRLHCIQNDVPVSCAYNSLNLQVGGGDQNGVIGTAAFHWSLSECAIVEDEDLALHFDCVWIPDRGYGIPFETIWLGAFSGQGGQLHKLVITFFGIDWSGVVPTPTPMP